MAGRKRIGKDKLPPNGIPRELEDWYESEAKRRTDLECRVVTKAQIKREALEAYRSLKLSENLASA